jgi:4-amino-4-deoxy-L-arabinose transferase-like glycosyltransferase
MPNNKRTLCQKIASFSIMAFLGLGMVSLSWQKWPDILVDFGRELYVPWQLNNGSVLFLNIDYFNGPFSPYLNSLIFKIFGTQLMAIAGFNLVLVGLLIYFIYYIFLKTTDVLIAGTSGTLFLALFAFSHYVPIGNYNFVTPYSHEMTHGILLSFLSIYAFLIYLKKRKDFWLGLIGISLGLVFLTKMEVFLSIFVAILVGVLLVALLDRITLRIIFKRFVILSLGFLLPVMGFVGYLSRHMSVENTLAAITTPYRALIGTSVISNQFYHLVMGLNAPLINLKLLFEMAAWYGLLVFFLFLMPAYAIGKISNPRLRMIARILIFLIVIFSIPFLLVHIPWLEIFRPLPLFILALMIYSSINLWRFRRDQQKTMRLLLILTLAIFSFLLLLKMILNVHLYHYGFALAMPGTLLAVMIFLYEVPSLIGRKFNNIAFMRILGIVMVAMLLVVYIKLSKNMYDLKTYAIGSEGDTILTWKPEASDRGIIIRSAIDKIEELVKPDETFVVFPEGVMLNYLTRRKNPCPYINFMPPELIMFGEDRILNSLHKAPPDYVILVDKDTSEYGYRYFGKNYGIKLFSWIQENYRAVQAIGNEPFSGKGFGIVIAKKVQKSS